MQIEIKALGKTYVLSDEHSASSYGVPVLVSPEGDQLGPWDLISKDGRNGCMARFVAGFAKEDYPHHPQASEIFAMVDKYESVPKPSYV